MPTCEVRSAPISLFAGPFPSLCTTRSRRCETSRHFQFFSHIAFRFFFPLSSFRRLPPLRTEIADPPQRRCDVFPLPPRIYSLLSRCCVGSMHVGPLQILPPPPFGGPFRSARTYFGSGTFSIFSCLPAVGGRCAECPLSDLWCFFFRPRQYPPLLFFALADIFRAISCL